MDRLPQKPPFPVGARVRYTGTRQCWFVNKSGEKVPSIAPGLEVEIERTRPGYRGTLAHLRDSDGPMYYDDTGDPILDETKDGYSVYVVRVDGQEQGRCIDIEDAHEWEVASPSNTVTPARRRKKLRLGV